MVVHKALADRCLPKDGSVVFFMVFWPILLPLMLAVPLLVTNALAVCSAFFKLPESACLPAGLPAGLPACLPACLPTLIDRIVVLSNF